MDRNKTASRVSWITLGGNLALTALKVFVGMATGSLVVLSDAAHSASDALSTILVIFGLYIARQPPDENTPPMDTAGGNYSSQNHRPHAHFDWRQFWLFCIESYLAGPLQHPGRRRPVDFAV